MAIDLYLMIFSPPCRTVLAVARQLGLEVNLKNLDLRNKEHLNPDFIQLNPAHTVPTIDDDGFALWESRAIAQYLCNKYAPDSDLYPQDPKRRAVIDRMLNFDIGTLFPSMREGLLYKYLRGIEPTEEKVNALKNNLRLLDLFIGGNKYVAGNHLTIADLSILSMTMFFIVVEYDLTDYPNLKEWLERMQTELPYFDEVHGGVIRDAPTIFAQYRSNNANSAQQLSNHENK